MPYKTQDTLTISEQISELMGTAQGQSLSRLYRDEIYLSEFLFGPTPVSHLPNNHQPTDADSETAARVYATVKSLGNSNFDVDVSMRTLGGRRPADEYTSPINEAMIKAAFDNAKIVFGGLDLVSYMNADGTLRVEGELEMRLERITGLLKPSLFVPCQEGMYPVSAQFKEMIPNLLSITPPSDPESLFEAYRRINAARETMASQ